MVYWASPKNVLLAILVLAAVLPNAGSTGPKPRPQDLERPELFEMRQSGNVSFRAGQYLQAIRIYERGYETASRRGESRSALRFLNNLGGAQYKIFRYRDAIKAYLEARDLATSQRDFETLAAIYNNLSSLYDQMGEMDAAAEMAERGLELSGAAAEKYRAL